MTSLQQDSQPLADMQGNPAGRYPYGRRECSVQNPYPPHAMPLDIRVCELSPYSLTEVSGVTSLILELSRAFVSRGHPTIVAAPGPAPQHLPNGIACWAMQSSEPFRDLSLAFHVARRLWRERGAWELLHVHQGHPATVAGAVVARLLGRLVVTTFHLVPPEPGGVRKLVQRSSIALTRKASTRCIYVSNHTKCQFGGDGAVIRNGVDVGRIRSALGDRDTLRRELGLAGCVIIFAGRMARIKGYLDLLAAVRKTRDAGLDVRLLTTGRTPEGEERDAKRLIRELAIDPFVVDLGEREDHLRFLAAADVFALPSYREGLPISLLEAMAAGLPSVVSDVGGMPELIEEGREGYLVPAGDVNTLADRIRRLSERPDLCASMGQRALGKAKAQDVGRVADAYLSVFTHCLESAQ